MVIEMFGKVEDASCQARNLYVGAAGISFMELDLFQIDFSGSHGRGAASLSPRSNVVSSFMGMLRAQSQPQKEEDSTGIRIGFEYGLLERVSALISSLESLG